MSDDRVEPIGEVDGSVGPHVQIDGAEGVMGGREERFQGLQPVTGSFDGWAQTGEVSGVVSGDEEVALQVVGKVRRVDDLDAHRLDLGLPDGHGSSPKASADMVGVHQTGQQFADTGAVALDERFTPVSKGISPWVATTRGTAVGVQLATQRTQSPGTVLIEAGDAPRCLHAGEAMKTLAEEQFAPRAPGQGIDILVGVAGAESGEQYLALIRLAVAIGITQMHEIGTFRQVDATMPEGESGRHVQAIGKNGDLVGLAILILVFENEQFVVRRFTWLQLGISPRTKNPQPAFGIPSETNRVGDPHGFVREEVDLVALG